MSDTTLDGLLRQLRRLAGAADSGRLSDGDLLARFVRDRDQAAFEVLVWRHGPMVLAACKRVLRREHDAEDAFQAAFLALARKAHTVAKCGSVGSWLYKVAWRAALALREQSARRAARERDAGADAPDRGAAPDHDLRPALDEEVNRLPEKYRAPVVLCYLEGKSNEEAARQLGCPPGTLAVRLLRARERLRAGLARRGLAPTAAVLAAALAEDTASAAVPASLVDAAVSAAPAFAGGQPATAAPAALAQGVLRTMFLGKVRNCAVAVATALALAVAGLVALQHLNAAPPDPRPQAQPQPKPQPAPKPDPRPAPQAGDVAAVVGGNNRFAFDLLAQLGKKDGNLFFSPYSISTALAMTYAGARGKTAEEMAKTLHFTLGQDRLHPAFAALAKEVAPEGKKRPVELRVANALWGQHDYPFLRDFTDLTRANYGAGLRLVDFKGAREEARQGINAWVEKQTQDRIKGLVRPGILTKDTRLVLTNAVFFLGTWEQPFNKKLTREVDFDTGAGNKVKVPMMSQSGPFRYFGDKELQGLELPYKGGELAMVLLLPGKQDGLPDVEKGLAAGKLHGWLGRLKSQWIVVSLPRFEVAASFELKPVLSALGMPAAFVFGRSDFSGMDGQYTLFLQEVVHKAFVKVDEVGTEAAAGGMIGGAGGRVPQFRAERPFVFLIRDVRSGSVLFVGRVADPTAR